MKELRGDEISTKPDMTVIRSLYACSYPRKTLNGDESSMTSLSIRPII